MAIIGIDLGTTNSLVSVWQNGESVLIPNGAGEVLTPSMVSIGKGGALLVGQAAKECLLSKPERTVCKFKRFMGTGKKYRIGKKEYTPEELSAMVLRKLKQDAERYLGEKITEAVVSVPAYFNDDQRAATKRAGKLAGLNVERLVNEPSAAALACQTFYPEEESRFMVIDFGGGTLDISVVECFEQVINILAVSGDNHLGGIDFDEAIAVHYCKERGIEFAKQPRKRQEIILKSAEAVKIALSDSEEADMTVPGEDGQDSIALSREQLIGIAAPVFDRFIKPVKRVLEDADLSINEIDRIIMAGGSCKMPVIEMYIRHILNLPPVYAGSPDTIVAQGVGVYAAIKERKEGIRDTVLTDICPFSLGLAMHNEAEPGRDIMSVLIERNTVLPASQIGIYYPIHDRQKEIKFKVCQGEGYYAEDCLFLGEMRIPIPRCRKEKAGVEVRFTYDINGILEVWFHVLETGEKKQLIIRNEKNSMTEDQIQARLKELEKLKLLPYEQEENRILIEKAEALFAESTGGLKKLLFRELSFFMHEIEGNSVLKAAEARHRMAGVIEAVQNRLSGIPGMTEGNFPDWYREMTEKTDERDSGGPDNGKGRMH